MEDNQLSYDAEERTTLLRTQNDVETAVLMTKGQTDRDERRKQKCNSK